MLQADLFAGALFITQATQIQGDYAIYIAILILLAIACIFTIAGGLSAVIWTDFVQTVLMIAGAFILTGICNIYINNNVHQFPFGCFTIILSPQLSVPLEAMNL